MSDSLDWAGASKAIQNWVVEGSALAADKVFWAYEGKPRPAAPYIEMTIQQVRGVGHDWTTTDDNTMTFTPLAVSAVSTSGNTLAIAAHPFANGDGPIHVHSTVGLPAPLLEDTDYWVIYVDANTIKLADSYVHTGGQLPLGVGNTITPLDLATTGSGSITVESTGDTVPAGKELITTAQGFREVIIHMECFAVEGMGYDAMRILANVVSSLQLHAYDLDLAGVGVSDLGQAFSQAGVQHLEGRRGSILEPRSMWDLTVYLASNMTGFSTIIESIDAELRLVREDGTTPLPAIPVHIP